MTKLILKRFCAYPNDGGTFGQLWFESSPDKKWWTVEKPWKNNEPSVSCIPPGIYKLRLGTFMAGGGYKDLEFVHVPGRENIEIHRANKHTELKGCIAPGRVISLDTQMVGESRLALDEILSFIVDDSDLWIDITWAI